MSDTAARTALVLLRAELNKRRREYVVRLENPKLGKGSRHSLLARLDELDWIIDKLDPKPLSGMRFNSRTQACRDALHQLCGNPHNCQCRCHNPQMPYDWEAIL